MQERLKGPVTECDGERADAPVSVTLCEDFLPNHDQGNVDCGQELRLTALPPINLVSQWFRAPVGLDLLLAPASDAGSTKDANGGA